MKNLILFLKIFIFTNIAFSQNNQSIEVKYLAILEPFDKEMIEKTNNSLFEKINNSLLDKKYRLIVMKNGFSFRQEDQNMLLDENQKLIANLVDAAFSIQEFYYDKENNLLFSPFNNINVIIEHNYDWILSNDSKLINNFLCYKSTCEVNYLNKHGNISVKKITAWYAPEINYNYGPNGYMGLPGMILEVEVDKTKLVAIEILFLKDAKKIEFPKFKTISEKELIKKTEQDFKQ